MCNWSRDPATPWAQSLCHASRQELVSALPSAVREAAADVGSDDRGRPYPALANLLAQRRPTQGHTGASMSSDRISSELQSVIAGIVRRYATHTRTRPPPRSQ